MALKPTILNLQKYGAEPLTRWLISAAKNRHTITYGEAKQRLEQQCGFSTIFSPMMGKPAGQAMDSILKIDKHAPLLNILLVQQGDGMPGKGAGDYLANYFGRPTLARKNARKDSPKEWRKFTERAAKDVYEHPDWEDLYRRVYKRKFVADPQAIKRKAGTDGAEKDGLRRGRFGEGQNHKALRLWVTKNPVKISPGLTGVRAETEEVLLSGDRVDAVYYAVGKTVAIEVKSRDSNELDLLRGIYQCVKYRAVLSVTDVRSEAPVEAVLVTETSLPRYLHAVATRLEIKHVKVPLDR